MTIKKTNNGKKGGLLVGKKHDDKNGNPIGGIKAVIGGDKKPVELEGGEAIINAEATKLHWKILSKINQSAGDGVPILSPDSYSDSEEFAKGGNVITFNPNNIPSKRLYNYAKKIKEQYPNVWSLGGNIFGNEAFKNLEKVIKRGYWLDSEEWFYIKWKSFCARHSGDFRIEGVIANLKWLNKVDKGEEYMKDLIQKESDKKEKGGNVEDYSVISDIIKIAKEKGYYEELKRGLSDEKEHSKTLDRLFKKEITTEEAMYLIANEHLKDDKKYYTKISEMDKIEMSFGGKVGKVMSEYYHGKLKLPNGEKVKNKQQALAIGFAEQRKLDEARKMAKGGNVSTRNITIAVDGDKKTRIFEGKLTYSDVIDKGFFAENIIDIEIIEGSDIVSSFREFAENKVYEQFKKHLDTDSFMVQYKILEDGSLFVESAIGDLMDMQNTAIAYNPIEFEFVKL